MGRLISCLLLFLTVLRELAVLGSGKTFMVIAPSIDWLVALLP